MEMVGWTYKAMAYQLSTLGFAIENNDKTTEGSEMTINLLCKKIAIGLTCIVSGIVFTCLSAEFSTGEEILDIKADELLKSMSSYLGNTKKFTVDTDIDFEIVTSDAQKLQLSSFAKIIMERPSKLHIQREGMDADVYLIYDGETLTLYGEKTATYGQLSGTGTIDDVFMIYQMETGLPVPGTGILLANPYEALTYNTESSSYIGVGDVNGIRCHHLAFREDKVDWQIWVQAGEIPLPMKLIITSKFLTSGPQYEMRFRNWNTNPTIDDNIFTFLPPDGAEKVDSLPTEELLHFTSADVVVMARQSIRKKITRTEVSIPILPENCIPVVLQGVPLQNCEGIHYLLEEKHYIMVDID